jgi:Outer membrane protein beta-barrel domain
MRRALFALMALLPLLPAAATAQVRRFEITPFAGYRLSGEVDNSSGIGFDLRSDVEIDEGAHYGVMFDIPLSRRVQLELLASRQKTAFIVDDGLLSPSENLGDVDLGLYQAGFLFQWGEGQVSPFVVASLGMARLEPDFPELDAENYLAGSFGGGVKIFLAENVGLRLEGRGTWLDLQTDFDNRYDRYDSDSLTWLPEGSAGIIFSW